ncbi:MAG: hypothetical protein HY695_13105 [Deltaproteobacteria bacterium]|nr:hypothetical protein [Deltaproteobacteria bacterium]
MAIKTIRKLGGLGNIGPWFAALLVSTCAALFWNPAATAQTTYSITDLGTQPGATCVASAINDNGEVVGHCSSGSFNEVAFVWRNGVMTSLGKLPRANYSQAHAINSQGVVVGEGDTGDFRPHPTLYRNGTVIDIDASGGNARAIYINDNGIIVGDYSKGFGNASSWSAVIWTEEATKPGRFRRISLEPYPGGDSKSRYGYATGANQDIQVVGWVQNSLFGQMGAFWNNDANHTLSLLEPVPGDWTSIAWGMNDFGQAVGESHPPFGSRPVLWDNDGAHTPVELPLLPGDNYGSAGAINNRGHILGSSAYGTQGTWNVGPRRLVIWRDGGVFELQSLLDPLTGDGWTLTSASAINDLGQIVGNGLHNGQPAAFLMSPVIP